jgi:hypothetical protein
VGVPASDGATPDEALLAVHGQLAATLRETPAAVRARVDTIAACLAALGRESGTPLDAGAECDGGWIVVRARDAAVACALTEISGVPAPVAVAVASCPAVPVTGGPGARLVAQEA